MVRWARTKNQKILFRIQTGIRIHGWNAIRQREKKKKTYASSQKNPWRMTWFFWQTGNMQVGFINE